jgi:hypothetical protein
MEQVYEFSTPKIFGATYKLSTLQTFHPGGYRWRMRHEEAAVAI